MIESDGTKAGGYYFKEDKQICMYEVLGPITSTTPL